MHSVIHSYIKYMSSPRIQLGFLTHHCARLFYFPDGLFPHITFKAETSVAWWPDVRDFTHGLPVSHVHTSLAVTWKPDIPHPRVLLHQCREAYSFLVFSSVVCLVLAHPGASEASV